MTRTELPIHVDGDSIVQGRRRLAVGKLRARLVQALLDHHPDFCTMSELLAAGWRDDPKGWPEALTLRVHMTNIRRKLEEFDLILENSRAYGYRIVDPTEQKEA